MLKTKRVYEPAKTSDATRFLVAQMWPREIKKEALKRKGWLEDRLLQSEPIQPPREV